MLRVLLHQRNDLIGSMYWYCVDGSACGSLKSKLKENVKVVARPVVYDSFNDKEEDSSGEDEYALSISDSFEEVDDILYDFTMQEFVFKPYGDVTCIKFASEEEQILAYTTSLGTIVLSDLTLEQVPRLILQGIVMCLY